MIVHLLAVTIEQYYFIASYSVKTIALLKYFIGQTTGETSLFKVWCGDFWLREVGLKIFWRLMGRRRGRNRPQGLVIEQAQKTEIKI